MMALISLGYSRVIAEKAITRARKEGSAQPASLQQLIKAALRLASAG